MSIMYLLHSSEPQAIWFGILDFDFLLPEEMHLLTMIVTIQDLTSKCFPVKGCESLAKSIS